VIFADRILTYLDGMQLLRSLHRRTCVQMMEDTSPLQEFITRKAGEYANRCLAAILPMTTFGQHHPTTTAHEWLASMDDGIAKQDRIIQAFSFAIKLKYWLPLTEQCYEFYVPQLGCSPPENYAVGLDSSCVEGKQIVELCLMPGVVEYSPVLFSRDTSGPLALWGERNIVEASEDQRKRGRVVSPATVVVAAN